MHNFYFVVLIPFVKHLKFFTEYSIYYQFRRNTKRTIYISISIYLHLHNLFQNFTIHRHIMLHLLLKKNWKRNQRIRHFVFCNTTSPRSRWPTFVYGQLNDFFVFFTSYTRDVMSMELMTLHGFIIPTEELHWETRIF